MMNQHTVPLSLLYFGWFPSNEIVMAGKRVRISSPIKNKKTKTKKKEKRVKQNRIEC